MNATDLLHHYARISEAPDAIPKLRRFVLDLAVRGKLVEQDATDEPSSELLIKITQRKLIEAKESGVSNIPTEKASDDQLLFELPAPWQWVPAVFPAVGLSDKGKKVKTRDVLSDGCFPVVDQGKVLVRGFCDDSDKVIKVADPLIVFGDHTRETKFIDFDFVVGADGVKLLKPIGIYPKYYFLALGWLPLDSRGYGRHFKLLKSSQIPLPPLAEQHRIVAKVDELMALCDRLEEARTAREGVRDKLTAASLARLTAPETTEQDFQSHARFALQSLPSLTTRPDQIKPLRQTILNLAVRGKLVEQDAGDEPAAELLKRISVKRAELVKSGAAKRLKEPKDEGWPFDIPRNWSWCALGQLSSLITKGSSPKWQGVGYVEQTEGLLFITSENVGNFSLRKLDDLKYVEARFKEVEPRSMLNRDDILINLVGASIGRTAIYDLDTEANINQAVALVRMVDPQIKPSLDYLLKYLNSDMAVDSMLGSRVTTAQPNISLADVNGFPIPLPPLAEQHRIVTKVDALMALCDRLETSLTTADTTRQRLLTALLHEALEPAVDELEAAE